MFVQFQSKRLFELSNDELDTEELWFEEFFSPLTPAQHTQNQQIIYFSQTQLLFTKILIDFVDFIPEII